MTKEEKEQQTKLLQFLSSPDEVNVELALTMAGGAFKKALGKAWKDRVKSYQELHQLFFRNKKWDNEQATSHIAALNQPVLYGNKNRLNVLPENIGNLQNLQELYLDDNRLTRLPESLIQLSSLRKLYISDNPGLTITPSQKEWLKSKPGLHLDVDLDKIRVKGKKKVFNIGNIVSIGRMSKKNSRNPRKTVQ